MTEESFEVHGLDTTDMICFYEQDYYFMSSFSSFALQWKGMRFDTLEAAYHYEKFTGFERYLTSVADRRDVAILRGNIRNAKSAHEAFKLGQTFKNLRRPDWDSVEGKVRTMFCLVMEKIKQHDYVQAKVQKTYGRLLVENSYRDGYWGWGEDRKGLNVLGQIWMLCRRITEDGELYTIDPLVYPLNSIVVERTKLRGHTTNFVQYDEAEFFNEKPQSATELSTIKVPLPAWMEDTPELRQRMTEFLLYLNPPPVNNLEHNTTYVDKDDPRASFVDVSKIRIGDGR